MSVIVLLIVAGGLVAGGFLAAFGWAVHSGQFDDTTSPPIRMLFDEATTKATGDDVSPTKDSIHADSVS